MKADDWIALGTIVIAAFTVIVAVNSGIQAWLTRKAIDDSNKQHRISNRAFVHFTRLENHWREDAASIVQSGFLVVFWKNSGNTTTSKATARANWTQSAQPNLAEGFAYPMPAARSITLAPGAEIGAPDILEIPTDFFHQCAVTNVFVWGRIDYDDVLGGKGRYTKFCYRYISTPNGNGGHQLTLAEHGPHNGTEEG